MGEFSEIMSTSLNSPHLMRGRGPQSDAGAVGLPRRDVRVGPRDVDATDRPLEHRGTPRGRSSRWHGHGACRGEQVGGGAAAPH